MNINVIIPVIIARKIMGMSDSILSIRRDDAV